MAWLVDHHCRRGQQLCQPCTTVDVGVEQAAGDADGDAAEASGIEQRQADGIERPLLAALNVDISRAGACAIGD